jgi:purine-binding chemotaxis protein CheW
MGRTDAMPDLGRTDALLSLGRTDALLCRVHESVCALPLEHVVEVMRPLPVEGLSGAPPFVAGLARIRGLAVPVVDLGRLITGVDVQDATRFVTVRSAGRVVALEVDAVMGIAPLSGALSELPPLFHDDDGPIAALGDRDRALLLVLSTARLVPPEVAPSLVGGTA